MKATVTPILDTRKAKADGTYPVRIEIYFNEQAYRFGIGESCTVQEAITYGCRVKRDMRAGAAPLVRMTNIQRSQNKRIQAIRKMAEDYCEKVGHEFNYEAWTSFYRPKPVKDDGQLSFYDYWQRIVDELKVDKRVGTGNSYLSALKKFKTWRPELDFKDLNVQLFKDFEKYMLTDASGAPLDSDQLDHAKVTIGFYCRSARAVIYKAVKDGIVKGSQPIPKIFGNPKDGFYRIPGKGKRLNKWLQREDMQRIFEYPAVGKAGFYLDVFQFMYRCNGIYPVDVVFMKWSNLREEPNGRYLVFKRKKTENTTTEPENIIVKVTQAIQDIIDRRAVPGRYMFGIINDTMDAEIKRNKQRDLTSAINTVLKRVCNELKIDPVATCKTARHSWAQDKQRKGVEVSVISKALGHTSVTTTDSYLGTMNTEHADRLAEMDEL